jgi:hypothetical protein
LVAKLICWKSQNSQFARKLFAKFIHLRKVFWQIGCSGFSNKSVWPPRKFWRTRNYQCSEACQARKWV